MDKAGSTAAWNQLINPNDTEPRHLSHEDLELSPHIPDAVTQRWGIVPVSYLGGRLNQHWLVEYGHSQLVVRGYSDEAFPHIAYELEILAGLDEAGWAVPAAVEEPIQVDGRTWCLFKFLPGTCRTSNSPEDRRARGRLLAELHEATISFRRMGQRRGFGLSDEVIGDPGLIDSIRKYEQIRPSEGHILRWHIDQATAAFDRLDLDGAATTVLHSDFTPWNLLYEGERLSGILDFEATHLNYRVADFGNSWRGYQDEVIDGYETVSKLSDLEWELLAPAYWAWMFMGVKQTFETTLAENVAPPNFDWQIRHLLRREGLMGRFVDPYPVTVHSPA